MKARGNRRVETRRRSLLTLHLRACTKHLRGTALRALSAARGEVLRCGTARCCTRPARRTARTGDLRHIFALRLRARHSGRIGRRGSRARAGRHDLMNWGCVGKKSPLQKRALHKTLCACCLPLGPAMPLLSTLFACLFAISCVQKPQAALMREGCSNRGRLCRAGEINKAGLDGGCSASLPRVEPSCWVL